MNGSVIDTNVIIKFLNGDKKARQIFDENQDIAIPVTVVGELVFGAYKSARTQENLEIFNGFISQYTVLPIDKSVADIYGEIKAGLAKKGVNLPENDIWIAATAKANRCRVISFDSHFSHIETIP